MQAYDAAITAQEPDPEILVACASIWKQWKERCQGSMSEKSLSNRARVTSLIFSPKNRINRSGHILR
jgi:hypothetical protein